MHRWSPHCALGWLQAELEEAEQEAEVRGGGWACMGTRRRPTLSTLVLTALKTWELLLWKACAECLATAQCGCRHCPQPWAEGLTVPTCDFCPQSLVNVSEQWRREGSAEDLSGLGAGLGVWYS